MTRVTSHPPPGAAAYFVLLVCVWLTRKLFRCRFVPLLEPNPGDATAPRRYVQLLYRPDYSQWPIRTVQISFRRKPRPPQCSRATLARVPKVTPSKNPRSANAQATCTWKILRNMDIQLLKRANRHAYIQRIVTLIFAVRLSESYDKCINTINCTGQNMSNDLLEALSNVDLTRYLCSEDHRPSESKFISFLLISFFLISTSKKILCIFWQNVLS